MSTKAEGDEINKEVESLTMHGLSRVASAQNKYTRFIWLALCLAAATALGMTAVKSLIKYFDYQVLINVNVKHSSNMALPAITFCHTNYYNPIIFNSIDPPVFQHFPESCDFTDRKYFKNDINMLIFHFTCRLFFGTFDAKTSAVSKELPKYFRFPEGFSLAPHKYPCVTLNRNSTLVQYVAGESYGLHMILFNDEISDPTFTYKVERPLSDKRDGIYVMIHDPKQQVTAGDGIVLPPGFHTRIVVTKNKIKRLPYPYPSKCVHGGSDDTTIYPGKNTMIMCYSSCALKELYRMCPGVIPEMTVFMKPPEFSKKVDISNSSFWACIKTATTKIRYQNCDCKQHCEEEGYTTISQRNPWPQEWQAQAFLGLLNKIENVEDRNLSTKEIRDRLIKISIYYDDFLEHVYEEKAANDLSSIASDLGGQMGLFLGASLLSLAEIIALVATHVKRRMLYSNRVVEVSLKPVKK